MLFRLFVSFWLLPFILINRYVRRLDTCCIQFDEYCDIQYFFSHFFRFLVFSLFFHMLSPFSLALIHFLVHLLTGSKWILVIFVYFPFFLVCGWFSIYCCWCIHIKLIFIADQPSNFRMKSTQRQLKGSAYMYFCWLIEYKDIGFIGQFGAQSALNDAQINPNVEHIFHENGTRDGSDE